MPWFWRGSLPALYSPGGRVTSRLDLRDNRKVITDYKHHGIIRILTDHGSIFRISSPCLAEGAEQSRASQGFFLWAGPPLGAQPMWSAVGIRGRTPHRPALVVGYKVEIKSFFTSTAPTYVYWGGYRVHKNTTNKILVWLHKNIFARCYSKKIWQVPPPVHRRRGEWCSYHTHVMGHDNWRAI